MNTGTVMPPGQPLGRHLLPAKAGTCLTNLEVEYSVLFCSRLILKIPAFAGMTAPEENILR